MAYIWDCVGENVAGTGIQTHDYLTQISLGISHLQGKKHCLFFIFSGCLTNLLKTNVVKIAGRKSQSQHLQQVLMATVFRAINHLLNIFKCYLKLLGPDKLTWLVRAADISASTRIFTRRKFQQEKSDK